MLTAQVVSVLQGCGQTAFAGRNLDVHSHNLRPLNPDCNQWGVIKHIRNAIIKRQCTVISARKDVHDGLIRMGLNVILVYPHLSRLNQLFDAVDLMRYLDSFQGPKIRLIGDQSLSDVIEYDRVEHVLREKQQ